MKHYDFFEFYCGIHKIVFLARQIGKNIRQRNALENHHVGKKKNQNYRHEQGQHENLGSGRIRIKNDMIDNKKTHERQRRKYKKIQYLENRDKHIFVFTRHSRVTGFVSVFIILSIHLLSS